MKIAILSNSDNYHTQKWVTAIAQHVKHIVLISLNNKGEAYYDQLENVSCHLLGLDETDFNKTNPLKKINYLTFLSKIKRIIKEEQPDILHAHYASSYGLLGALCNFSPYIVSVWGTDIYEFPQKNLICKQVIQYVLKRADKILSTSHCMALETKKYTSKPISVTPFGIDVNKFSPLENKHPSNPRNFVIGTVKTLKPKYGIDKLIKAFAVIKKFFDANVMLKIAGTGTHESEYKTLVSELELSTSVEFLGFVDNEKVPELLNSFDVYVALSQVDSESFGVAAVEAMACEVPVVVSDVDGFKEVVPDNAGFIVDRNDVNEAAEAILILLKDDKLRQEMGKNGRAYVLKHYDFTDNLSTMLNEYSLIKEWQSQYL